MFEVISVECIPYDPRVVRVTIQGDDTGLTTTDFNESDYKVLALLPIFPPDPCEGKVFD